MRLRVACLDSCHTRPAWAEQHGPRRGDDGVGHENDGLPRRKPAHVAERQLEAVPDEPGLHTSTLRTYVEISSGAFAGKPQHHSAQKSKIRPSSHSDNASLLSVSVSVTSPFVPSTSVSRSPCPRFVPMVTVTMSCLTMSQW